MSLLRNDIVSFWFWGYRGYLRTELQAPVVWSGSTLYVKEASKCFSRQKKHTTFCDVRFKG